MTQKVRVGLPRGLLYHEYGRAWEKFFEGLGAAVIVSGETTKKMLDTGGRQDWRLLLICSGTGGRCD
ncbi:acyl-CoA dehydratase activase-related protein [Sporomusa carbonis]|uniref:acyl-CoA dehydratase activase-related protein n=1 Tax=Sporomusa carbonis TaxID=3076075 RepID=UPI003C7DBC27